MTPSILAEVSPEEALFQVHSSRSEVIAIPFLFLLTQHKGQLDECFFFFDGQLTAVRLAVRKAISFHDR
eukprot:m.192997 g.192997  ORF g.192997 m.192997 type:complete len:69 (+) comp39475_c1_seq14:396-602(+)